KKLLEWRRKKTGGSSCQRRQLEGCRGRPTSSSSRELNATMDYFRPILHIWKFKSIAKLGF
ncbi:hypothetical protein TorRG33x02_340970, partial [Trema orientale]